MTLECQVFWAGISLQGKGSGLIRFAVTEMSVPSFSHPAGVADPAVGRLTATEAAFAALGYAIQKGDLEGVREMLEGDEFNHQLLKIADYAGNTALVRHVFRRCHHEAYLQAKGPPCCIFTLSKTCTFASKKSPLFTKGSRVLVPSLEHTTHLLPRPICSLVLDS